MSKSNFTAFRNDDRGTTAIEFAIVAPAFIILLIGTIYLCLGLFLAGSLHYAVEEGARCASVRTTAPAPGLAPCRPAGVPDATAIKAYTKYSYFGPVSSPTFNYNNPSVGCGNTVTGSANFHADLGITTVTIPISASACFP